MGLSSSQARLLNLTSRMHQIEYKAAKLEAEKLQMANESTRAYEDYLEALEATKIQKKVLTTDGSITYQDFTNYDDFLNAGFCLKYNGAIYIDGEWNLLLSDLGINTSTNFEKTLTNIINSGEVVIVTKDKNGNFQNITTDFETSVATNTGLREVADESNLKKEEAKYEASMKKIDMKDRRYDQDLSALDAERNAVKQEMETLQTVAKDNVDRTFKIFS